LDLPEFTAQEIETNFAVALLVALLGRDGGDASRPVDEPDSGADFIHILATMASGTEELPFEVFIPNRDFLGIDFGEDGYWPWVGCDLRLGQGLSVPVGHFPLEQAEAP
jgi:hypothetical protein